MTEFETVLLAVSCYADHKNVPPLAALLSRRPPEFTGRYPKLECPPEEARQRVWERIEHRISEYTAMIEELIPADEASLRVRRDGRRCWRIRVKIG